MQLSTFIRGNLDEIVSAWEVFARALPAGKTMSGLALRDHCREMLVAISHDMDTGQTLEEQASKSTALAPPSGSGESAAESHGALRHLAGFDLIQLVAEFRALRASVLSLWEASAESSAVGTGIRDITRFNEGLDQALAESVHSYSQDMADSRDMFVGVLGHDLRGPLSVIKMSNLLLAKPTLSEAGRATAVARSGTAVKEMSRLISNLLDYTRSRLGAGIPLDTAECDLGAVCRQALDAIEASHPDVRFELSVSGDLLGRADAAKLGQALANLLGNAAQHGDRSQAITLVASGGPFGVIIEVANTGAPIPASALESIFEPMARGPMVPEGLSERSRSSMGLGLFIAREIVGGHRGTIVAQSDDSRTVFKVTLPRLDAVAKSE